MSWYTLFIEYKSGDIMNRKRIKPLFKNQLMVTGICVLIIVVLVFSVSFAKFSKTKEGHEYNIIKVGELELSYVDLSDEGNALSLVSEYPISDKEGIKGDSYRFSVENTGTLVTNYKVRIVNDSSVIENDNCGDNLINNDYIHYAFDNENANTLSNRIGYNYDDNNQVSDIYYEVYSGTLQPYESDIHEVRVWIADDSPNSIIGNHFHGKVVIVIEQGNGNNSQTVPLKLKTGTEIHDIFVDLAGGSSNISAIKMASNVPDEVVKQTISTNDSRDEVISYYLENEKTIYIYSNGSIYMNNDSSMMFQGLVNLEDISALADFNTKNVDNMSGMFKDCTNLVDLTALNDWNLKSNVNTSDMFNGTLATIYPTWYQ